jgi:hypothetical protein
MKNLKVFLVFASMLVPLAGCEKFLDVNQNPDVPTKAQESKLLTFSEEYLAKSLSQDNFLGNGLSVYVHQVTVREEPDKYGMSSNANGITNSWTYLNVYVVRQLDEIIAIATAADNMQYAGIAKALKAYTYSQMTDVWGDIPFSEAGDLENLHPNPDNDEAIYNACLNLLDEAIADMTDTSAYNASKPGVDDLIYGGNMSKWVRAANTMKLRMLNKTRTVKDKIVNWQAQFNALTANTDTLIRSGDDFEFWFNKNQTPSDQRHPEFVNSYGGAQITSYVSPWLYEIMNGKILNATENPLAGIEDPRVPYYYVNQMTITSAAQNPTSYRDGAFVSIFFGDESSYSSGAGRGTFSMLGIYPCGGAYDNGSGRPAGSTGFGVSDGTGSAPHKMITYFDVKFMLAELSLTGEYSADAAELFKDGITAAFAHLNKVSTTGDNAGKASAITTAARDAYINDVMDKYNAANNDGKLELVMTQKWIADIMNSFEQYTDYRRTGYPKMYVPDNVSGKDTKSPYKQQTAAEAGVTGLRTAVGRSFPKSLEYSRDEVDRNPNIKPKADLSQARLFWDTRTYDYNDRY